MKIKASVAPERVLDLGVLSERMENFLLRKHKLFIADSLVRAISYKEAFAAMALLAYSLQEMAAGSFGSTRLSDSRQLALGNSVRIRASGAGSIQWLGRRQWQLKQQSTRAKAHRLSVSHTAHRDNGSRILTARRRPMLSKYSSSSPPAAPPTPATNPNYSHLHT